MLQLRFPFNIFCIVQIYPIKKFTIAPGPLFNKAVRVVTVLALLLLLVVGCQPDEVKVYRVAKEPDQPPPQTAPALPADSQPTALPPGHPDISSLSAAIAPATSGSARPQLTWKTPEGWTEVPPGEMRLASFKVRGKDGQQADVSVIPLPGLAGSDEANVNRWRGQLGLSPGSPEELQKTVENVEAGGQRAQLYDLAGSNSGGKAMRIVGVIQHRAEETWFYKMTGDAGLVEQQKPAFIQFVQGVKY
jgi:hypothetical protein